MSHDYARLHTYHEHLCDCGKHFKSCCIVGFVPCGAPYYHAKAVHKAAHQSKEAAFCFQAVFCCIGHAMNRSRIRQTYDIQGTFVEDCILGLCCAPCSVCQDFREVKYRKKMMKHAPHYQQGYQQGYQQPYPPPTYQY